jgi:hypothetical protein
LKKPIRPKTDRNKKKKEKEKKEKKKRKESQASYCTQFFTDSIIIEVGKGYF